MNVENNALERERLKRAIEMDRAELNAAVSQLKGVVRQRTDVKRFAAMRPYTWLAGGLFVGYLLGKN